MKVRGWGIVLPGHELAHDHAKDRPFFVTTRRAAQMALGLLPNWSAGQVVRVSVESHPGDEGGACVTYRVTLP